MTIDWDIAIKVIMPLITLFLGAWLKEVLDKKEKLIAYYGHVASFKLTKTDEAPEDKWVFAHSVIVRNSGKKTANNVRLGHNVLPYNYVVSPDIEYEVKDLPGGTKELIFPQLTPKKEITISYLYNPPLTYEKINSHIESDSGPAKVVSVLLQQVYPKWVSILAGLLMISGLFSITYALAIGISSLI